MPERLRKPSVAPADIYARLERIKKLWLELEKVRVRTDEYEILIEKIHAESLAYMRLVDAKRGISAKDQTSN